RDARHAVLELETLERDTVLEPVDARDAVADLEDGADLAQVGLDLELSDAVLEDGGDLFGPELHVRLLRPSVRGREFLVAALSPPPAPSIEPTGRTMPTNRPGSTERFASTVRPDAFSIVSTIDVASASDSSCAVCSSSVRRFCARATRASSSSRIWTISPGRP